MFQRRDFLHALRHCNLHDSDAKKNAPASINILGICNEMISDTLIPVSNVPYIENTQLSRGDKLQLRANHRAAI